MRDLRRRIGLTIVGASMGVLGACASNPVILSDDTLMLGEARHILTRQLLDSGRILESDVPRDRSSFLSSLGWTDAQLDAGRLVLVRLQIYWNNQASGIVRDQFAVVLSKDGEPIEPGNIVELTADNHVTRVRARSLADGSCYYGNVPVGAVVETLGALSMVGPRGSASLYCKGIEREGWHRPRTYWHKLPNATPGAEPIDKPPSEVPLPSRR